MSRPEIEQPSRGEVPVNKLTGVLLADRIDGLMIRVARVADALRDATERVEL